MSTLLGALAWMVALAAGLPLAVLSLELLAGLLPARPLHRSRTSGQIAILIPAHDEAGGIEATIATLQKIAPAETRIVVVADNCRDETADLARTAGAEVLERFDDTARGKGFALAFGRDHLGRDPAARPDCVIILDADCRLSRGSIERLAGEALARQAPTQAINLISASHRVAPMIQISSFAMVVKNLFRSRGMQRLGGPALLTGTGMAFPWPLFERARLATPSIVEDLALGIEMTRAGHAPYLVEQAHVRSDPAAMRDALQQRTRWEHGFLAVVRELALPVLLGGLKRGSRAEALLGLHLLVPPLALTLMAALAAMLVVGGLTWAGASAAPAQLLAVLLALATGLLLLSWLAGGRPYLSGKTILRIPLYMLWKIPIYVGFLRKPEASWTRTPRRDRPDDDER